MKTEETFFFAGLWRKHVKPGHRQLETDFPDEPPPSCTELQFVIITTEANRDVGPVHDRMPVIIENLDWWLGGTNSRSETHLLALESSANYNLESYLVSTEVNDIRNDSVKCIRPVR
jgi:putative SOS response-associated peptidase YedK